MVSFSATFALAEQDWFLGIASLVQKILKDEFSIHVNRAKYVVNVLKQEFKESYNEVRDQLKSIVDEVVETEYTWSRYLFSEERKLVGFNAELSEKWIDYCSQEVYDSLDIPLPFERVDKTPLPFMDKWINVDKIQVAAQETQITNYKLNSWVDDIPQGYEFGWEEDSE